MAKILTNNTNTTPQPGGAICAVKVFQVEIAASELVLGAEFNLGEPPEGDFNYCATTAVSNLDGSVGLRTHVGTDDDVSHYAYSLFSTSATVGFQGGKGTGGKFPPGDIKLTVSALPTIAQDGVITITLYGWA